MTDLLHAAGMVRGEPEPIRHAVKFYEYGQAPLEIITTRQWYLSNGSQSKELSDTLLAWGRELRWHPEHMRVRYEHWVEGLTGDWLVSRQRYRGVPIPVWYRLDETGQPVPGELILPAEADLPVDPAADTPSGFQPGQRGLPGGFAADPDVMDTWATSSMTPQIACGWPADDDLMERVFPMDLRPQAHEIIRTWLFYTMLRSHAESGLRPWQHAAISGWILDPDRKKMSKSKGNAVTPTDLLREHGSDAVRYWATSARLGVDTAFDLAQIKVGRRLAIKLLNAGRFVLSFGQPQPDAEQAAAELITEPIDRAFSVRLARVTQVVHGCPGGLRPRHRARAGRAVLLVLLRRLPGAGEGPGLRRAGPAGHCVRAGNTPARPVGAAAPACPVPAVCDGGGVVLVAGRVDSPVPVASRRRLRGRRRSGRRCGPDGGCGRDRRDQKGKVAGSAADESGGPAARGDRRPGLPGRGQGG